MTARPPGHVAVDGAVTYRQLTFVAGREKQVAELFESDIRIIPRRPRLHVPSVVSSGSRKNFRECPLKAAKVFAIGIWST